MGLCPGHLNWGDLVTAAPNPIVYSKSIIDDWDQKYDRSQIINILVGPQINAYFLTVFFLQNTLMVSEILIGSTGKSHRNSGRLKRKVFLFYILSGSRSIRGFDTSRFSPTVHDLTRCQVSVVNFCWSLEWYLFIKLWGHKITHHFTNYCFLITKQTTI